MDETPHTEDHGPATPPAGEDAAASWPVPPPTWQGMPGAGWPAAPPALRTTRRWPKVAAAVGVAAGAAVGAGVIAAAATSPSSPGVSTAASSSSGSTGSGSNSSGSGAPSTTPEGMPPDGPGRHGGMFFGGFGGPGMLHGEFTVTGPNGGYETLQVQNGTVSSISDTSGSTWSLVVKSADGSQLTYVIDSGTSVDGGETGVSSIAAGDTVRVLATVSNGTATARQVDDQTVLQKNGQAWMPTPPGAPSASGSGPSGTSA